MTREEFQEVIDNCQYKPGYYFGELEFDEVTGIYTMTIQFETDDSRAENAHELSERVTLTARSTATLLEVDHWDVDDCLEWIRTARHTIACHESDEWFLYKGEMVFDPHAEVA